MQVGRRSDLVLNTIPLLKHSSILGTSISSMESGGQVFRVDSFETGSLQCEITNTNLHSVVLFSFFFVFSLSV